MKKSIAVWVICTILSVLFYTERTGYSDEESSIHLIYRFTQPIVSNVEVFGRSFQRIAIPGTDQYQREGEPVVPVKIARILLPYGKEAGDVSVIADEKVILKGNYNIEPGQRPMPLSSEIKPEYVPPDPEIYGASSPFPKARFITTGTQIKRGYRILFVNLFPVTYLPVSGNLSYYNEVTLIVQTRPQERPPLTYRGLARDVQSVSNLIDNPGLLATYPLGQK